MVKQEGLVFLFIGQDSFSKDIKIKRLREESLDRGREQFNLDILYGRELNLLNLQEKLLYFPLKEKKRIVVIKDAQALKKDVQEFIINYVKRPNPKIILVLDIDRQAPRDEFVDRLRSYVQICRFKEDARLDTFALSRSIDSRKTDYALGVLNQLLRGGEKPERILGGLRYVWENNITDSLEIKKRLKFLLNCDTDIKTGRLKPDFALEKLVVRLCCLTKPFC